ncbi:serpin B [Tindallia magadiensis]|uniref:Serpin B n=1 Tax=Tindallia magadiensis TaxID=69895 RepID=A0A1I3EWN2_9FIRM|nr:serpin family protein [Tindallia magadiensis]SFI03332.1 serpin B [Tindallia magadiensis]
MMKRKGKKTIPLVGICLLLLGLLLVGCDEVEADLPVEISEPAPEVLESFDQELANRSNQFGFQMFQQLMEGEENKMISPTSIYTALAMTMNGADGETREAMAKTLEVAGVDLETFNLNNKLRHYLLQEADEEVTLRIANSLWMREGISLKPAFIHNNQQYYSAVANALDFSTAEAVERINQWVEDSTEGLIEEIVEYPIDPQTILFLINAVYFQGDWTTAFDPDKTTEETFYRSEETLEGIPFMNRQDEFLYLEKEEAFQAIRLPYGEKEQMAMYVFLPWEGRSLQSFVDDLSAEQWEKWQHQFSRREGQLKLPRFTMAYEKSLKEALSRMGMEIAFDPAQADFSEMVSWEQGENVFISDVKHKSFIEVEETGTEAAAVTSVEVRVTSMPIDEPFQMVVNRPFYFMIHDEETNEILFMGTVAEPKQ